MNEGGGNASCTRFEELMRKEGQHTKAEWDFLVSHERDCPTGFHNADAIEEEYGLAPGTLANWDGEPGNPEIEEVSHKRLAAILFFKAVKMLPV